LRWFLRHNAPPALAARVRGAVAGHPPLN